MLTTTPPTASRARIANPALLLGLLAFAQLIIALDYNIVFVALPIIGEGLHFTESALQWVVSAYAVAFGGFLLLGGRLADLLGKRRVFLIGLALYGVASLVGGLATDPVILIVARAFQGLGGAFLSPATLSLVTTSFAEGKARNTALSVWAAAGSTGMVLGSLLGGVLTGSLGWESVFFVNVVLAGLAIVAALFLIPKDDRGSGDPRPKLDFAGAATGTIGVLAIVFALVQAPDAGWSSPLVLISGIGGIVVFLLFITLQRRGKAPLVPLRLFANRNLSLGTWTTFLFMATFGAIPYFLTIYLQQILHFSPLVTGLAFIIPSASVLIGATWGGRLGNRYAPRRVLSVAFAVGCVGTLALAGGFAGNIAPGLLAIPLVVLSVAQGVVFTTMFTVATTGVRAEDQGTASGIATAGQQIGGAVGLALLVVASSALATTGSGTDLHTQVTAATFVLGGALVLGIVVALFLPGRTGAEHARADTAADTQDPAADTAAAPESRDSLADELR
jgi:EmrB/QacA subfamily drug resistance transporter